MVDGVRLIILFGNLTNFMDTSFETMRGIVETECIFFVLFGWPCKIVRDCKGLFYFELFELLVGWEKWQNTMGLTVEPECFHRLMSSHLS